jgi:hypothetical protein
MHKMPALEEVLVILLIHRRLRDMVEGRADQMHLPRHLVMVAAILVMVVVVAAMVHGADLGIMEVQAQVDMQAQALIHLVLLPPPQVLLHPQVAVAVVVVGIVVHMVFLRAEV